MVTRARPRSGVLAALVLAVLAVTACGDGDDGPTEARPGSATTVHGDVALGERVFSSNCARCHGSKGGGGMGPKLADGRVVERYPDPADHREVVVNGRGAMPAWGDKLSHDEIDAVVRYEREGL